MWLGHMDVIALSHAGPAVPHQSGESELIHATLSAARSKRMPPAIELEGLQAGILCGFFVRMLHSHQMP